jgi:hypothetical protein
VKNTWRNTPDGKERAGNISEKLLRGLKYVYASALDFRYSILYLILRKL